MANREPAERRVDRAGEQRERLRRWAIYGIPATVTLAWLVAVLATGSLGRALDHWQSSLTMLFGSFAAGSSPWGGGVIAFPVFTKLLEVPAPVARTFALSIQALGMTAAAAVMLLARRPMEPRLIATGAASGSAGLLLALLLLGDRSTPFWESTLPAPYVKVTFTIVLAAMAYLMLVTLRDGGLNRGEARVPHWNRRVWAALVVATFIGGAISSMIGTGVNALLFLFAVTMVGLHPRVGVASSIVTMALVSLVGLLVLGIADGQLDIDLAASGEVVAVGGKPVGPLSADRYDLLGLWLAAAPVVVWGAPLGTYVVHLLDERRMIAFVALLAAAEVLSTFLLLDELHEDPALITYAVGGLVAVAVGVRLLRRYRRAILGLPAEQGEA